MSEKYVPPELRKMAEEEENAERERAENRVSRRKFLTLLGAAVASYGIRRGLGEAGITVAGESKEKEKAKLEEYLRELTRLSAEFTRRYGGSNDRSMADEEKVREEFFKSEAYKEIEDMALRSEDFAKSEIVKRIIHELAFFGVQGKFLETADKFGVQISVDDYYSSDCRDYIPTGKQIKGSDIDPRLNALKSKEKEVADLTSQDIKLMPAWADRGMQSEFSKLADNPKLRKMAADAGLAVAEFFSLIKAVIKFRKDRELPGVDFSAREVKNFATMDDEKIAEVLLKERRDVAERKILSKTTEHFIVFNGYDDAEPGDGAFFEGDNWDQIAAAAGVSRKKFSRHDVMPVEDNAGVINDFLKAIVASTGETVVAVNTHGETDRLGVNKLSKAQQYIEVETLAGALVERVVACGNPKSLGEMTILFDACFSYDFTKKLNYHINALWERKKSLNEAFASWKILMPRVHAFVQEGSAGWGNASLNRLLAAQTEGIKKDGALLGSRILKKVQPQAYAYNDFTFFVPDEGGGLIEVGEGDIVNQTEKQV